MITNVYNQKTKGPTLIEIFTTTGKLKKDFFDSMRRSMFAPRVIHQTSLVKKKTPFQFSCGCEKFH
jgi:hypothetical protein